MDYGMLASSESSLSYVHGPAKKPEWAQMIRLGGDRVAILLEELRKAAGKVDGIVEVVLFSGKRGGWVVQYEVESSELFTAHIAPGVLEVVIPLSRSEIKSLLRIRNLSGNIQEAIRQSSDGSATARVEFELMNRRRVHSFANLVMAKARFAQKSRK